MGLRKRRPGLLYYRVRLPCLHFVILASASRVDLRQTTQTDVAIRFFISKYNSPLLGILVSLVGIASLIPYLVLQLKGLGLIVSATSYGQIPPSAAVWIGAVSITIYVMISGIHGSAWISVVKDIMILGIVLYLGIYLPIHYYGGFTEMFKQIDAAKPGFHAAGNRTERFLVQLNGFADRSRLLYVAPYICRFLFGGASAGVSEKRNHHASLSARPAVCHLYRICGDSAGARFKRGGHGSRLIKAVCENL